MASGNTLVTFFPQDNEPPTAAYALLDTRNSHPLLAFNSTATAYAIFTGIMPSNYASSGVTPSLYWTAASATTGSVGWAISFERMAPSGIDIDANAFSVTITIGALTVPGTAGVILTSAVAVSNGTNMAGVAVRDMFRFKVERNIGGDDAAGNAELLGIEIRET